MKRQRTIRNDEVKQLLNEAISLAHSIKDSAERADFLSEVISAVTVTRQLRLSGDPDSFFECRMANTFDAYGFKAMAARTDSQFASREAKKAPKEPAPKLEPTNHNRMTLAQLAELAKEQA